MKLKLKKIEVKYLKGIGPKRAELLNEYGITTINDLLMYLPTRYLDRSNVYPIRELAIDEECTVIGEVVSSKLLMGRKKRLTVTVTDLTGILTVVFFNQPAIFKKIFTPGKKVALSGKVGFFRGYQFIHPDFEFIGTDRESGIHTGAIIPLYRIPEKWRKAGVSSHTLRRVIFTALEQYQSFIEEELPEVVRKKENLPNRSYALRQLHFPENQESFDNSLKYIKYEEIFYLLTFIGIQKHQYEMPLTGIAFRQIGEVVKILLDSLPFDLTASQKAVLREIYADMKKDTPMHRLIQGDVGSGKTIVALICMLIARENGFQTALMAPTEILAEQHYYNFKKLLSPFNIKPLLLKGGLKATERTKIISQLEKDTRTLVIGTHALIQKDVNFPNLGLVVIDEQHRFGVMQRAMLIDKGKVPDILVMTATPIPRSLAFTVFGDLDHSRISELPPGRLPVGTVWRTNETLPKVFDFIREKVSEGQQTYIVLPLIEESEKTDLQAAEKLYREISAGRFKDLNIGLLHGKMKTAEKELIMERFKNNEISILVSTTVIEVGVDVPNSTIMLIVDAQRFGLAQLHQLRGRVGRGDKKSYCVLITPEKVTDNARERMKILCETNDGFKIAEVDLKLRGMGEMLGARQHGVNELQFINFSEDSDLIFRAREDALEIIKKDPHLRKQDHSMIRERIVSDYHDKLVYIQSF